MRERWLRVPALVTILLMLLGSVASAARMPPVGPGQPAPAPSKPNPRPVPSAPAPSAPAQAKTVGSKKVAKLKTGLVGAAGQAQSQKIGTPTPAQASATQREQLAAKATSGLKGARPNHLLVKYKAGITTADVTALQALIKGTTVRRFKDGAELLRLPIGSSVSGAVAALTRSGRVQYAQPDYLIRRADLIPNDPFFPSQWGLKNVGQAVGSLPGGTPDIDINVTPAWDSTLGDPSVVVAIIDEGIDFNHPDLAGRQWVNPLEVCGDGIDNEGDGIADDCSGAHFFSTDAGSFSDGVIFDPADGDDHGTHVAGIIAANINNSTGVAGVAPNIKLMSAKFLGLNGAGWTSDGIAAIDYAASHGARIANASWGSTDAGPALRDAIANSGMLFVAAAGNSAANTDITPAFPASFDLPNIISVASINNLGQLSSFSNYGKTSVDLAAPGEQVLSTIPSRKPYAAAIQHDANYQTMWWGFSLDDVDPAEQAGTLQAVLNHFGAVPGSANDPGTPVLVIADDESDAGAGLPDVSSTYLAALAPYTLTYTHVNTNQDLPALDAAAFPVVIYTSGYSFGSNGIGRNLSDADLANLTAYLQHNGKLLVSGQDAIWANDHSDFVQNYLGVRYIREADPRLELTGQSGTAYDGQVINLVTTEQSNYRDDALPTDGSGAQIALVWTPYSNYYDDAYALYTGTSMAAPHVTGVAALVLSAQPNWSTQQVRDRILSTVKPLTSLSGMTATGGIVNAARALSFNSDDQIPGVPYPGWGQSVYGTLDGAGWSDLDDVYRISLQPGQTLKAWLTGDQDSPPTDFDLYLFGPGATDVNDAAQIIAGSESTGTNEYLEFKAPVGGEYYIDAFGYQGKGGYHLRAEWGDGPGRYEETHPALRYAGNWMPDSNGTIKISRVAGESVTFKFYGDGVNLWALRSPDMGLAKVTIDGAPQNDADMWSNVQTYGVVFQSGKLDRNVEHTLVVTNKGMRSPYGRKTAISINIDAIEVWADTAPPAAPPELYALAGNGYVQLMWPVLNNEPDLRGYNVYRSGNPGGPWTNLTLLPLSPVAPSNLISKQDLARQGLIKSADSPVPWMNYVDFAVANGYDYYYVIRAVDQAGNESFNSPVVMGHPDPAPAVVDNLTATGGDGQVWLSWTANVEPDMSRYDIFRHSPDDPEGWYFLISSIAHVPGQQEYGFADTGLPNEQEFSYLVFAVDRWGVRSDAIPVTARTVTPPPAVTGLQGQMNTDGITLTWDPVDMDGILYNVLRHNPDGTSEAFAALPAASFHDAVYDFSHDYEYEVAAVRFNVPGPFTPILVPDTMGPDVPWLTAAPDDGQVKLNWGEATAADFSHYLIHETAGAVPDQTVTAPPVTITGLTNETSYTFEVSAWDIRGNSGMHQFATAMPVNTSVPGVPTGLTATPGDSQVTLTWDVGPEPDLDGYDIAEFTGTGAHVLATVTGPFSGLTVSVPLTGLSNGVAYMLGVRAVDTAGNVSDYATVNVTPVSTKPAPPMYLSGTPGDGSATLGWFASPSNISGYMMLRSSSFDGPFTAINSSPFSSTRFLDTGLTNGLPYYYQVVAVGPDGVWSDPSNTVEVIPVAPDDTTPPTAPTGLAASAGDGVINLSWGASTDDSGAAPTYEVWFGTGSTQPTAWMTLTAASVTNFSHTGLTNGTTYWYKVTAVDAAGNRSGDSNVVWAMPNAGGVDIGFYENTSPSITFVTTWSKGIDASASGGSFAYSNTSGAAAKVIFIGTGVEWWSYKSQYYGISTVYLDGVEVASVDLYSSSSIYKAVVFDAVGLSSGVHELRIVRSGSKNSRASAAYSALDAVKVK